MTLILLTIGASRCSLEIFRVNLLGIVKRSNSDVVVTAIHSLTARDLRRVYYGGAQVFIFLVPVVRN